GRGRPRSQHALPARETFADEDVRAPSTRSQHARHLRTRTSALPARAPSTRKKPRRLLLTRLRGPVTAFRLLPSAFRLLPSAFCSAGASSQRSGLGMLEVN